MTECPICKGGGTIGYYHIDHFVDVECYRCNGSGEVSEVQMTNEEWFCSLSTEEKAKMLGRVSFCDFCPHQLSEHCAWTTGYSEDCVYGNKESEELWLNWLKEIHHEV